ncbi:UEV-domain-containing protein [Byssothecium circinans]|uniref:UEV-domain-containing protein n=1 Tax=Byssothecium circinans TaxID=147558 RepID=A0A6A5UCA5_9PLEO|nr:UEV-domain-containing protein [Byssothecium circinans]
MAGVPEKVLTWLYSVLPSEYTDVNRTYHDVAETLSNYPSLSPRTKVYTYENGVSALLLRIDGTVPVTFREQTYGFPIAIWVPHNYPREPPIVYVTPAQDMLIRPGQHVSGDGRVYHPYLAQWGKYWDKSTLFDFLAVLRGVFAKEPPVRSKQQQHYNAPATPAPPPVPPTPAEWRKSMHGTPSASPAPRPPSNALVPPPKPPKPYERSAQSPRPQAQQHDRYSQPPPLPPHPTHPQAPQQYPQQPQRNTYVGQNNWQQQAPPPQHLAQRQSSYDMSPATPVSRPHVQAPGNQGQSYELGSPTTTHPNTSNLPHRNQTSQTQPNTTHPLHTPINRNNIHLPPTNNHHLNLPVPPVPPNPEKDALLTALSATLCAQIRQTVSQNHAAIAPLQAQQSALQTAYAHLQSELEQLHRLDATLAANEKVLRDAMREADRVMEDARRRQVPDVDDVLVAPTVVGGQLYGVAAEERGIAEALFLLGKALDRGRVGVEVFVKQTRSLAREQFLKKALLKKISKGMGLDEYGMR